MLSSLRLVGLSQSSVLCFVIDTTGSMSDDIAEAKRVSFDIIDSKRGTQQEPSAYILVPFNDPGRTLSTRWSLSQQELNERVVTLTGIGRFRTSGHDNRRRRLQGQHRQAVGQRGGRHTRAVLVWTTGTGVVSRH